MTDLSGVQAVIAFFIFVSVSLLIYNLLYMLRDRWEGVWHGRRVETWLREISLQKRSREGYSSVRALPSHVRKIAWKLRRIVELTAYHDAMDRAAQGFTAEEMHEYLSQCREGFEELAAYYARRSDMEKAYFAHVLAEYPMDASGGRAADDMMTPFLLSDSVYSREYALRALYAQGDPAAVERALDLLARRGVFHHEILLAGGLSAFRGDIMALARRLWSRAPDWPEYMEAAVVRFISLTGADFAKPLLEAAAGKRQLSPGVRLAILEYFREHPYGPAKGLILEYLRTDQGVTADLAAAAASSAAAYPGEDTIEALKSALSSSYWDVRNNAAESLMALGVVQEDLKDVLLGNDRDALEMLCYHVQAQGQEQLIPQCAMRGEAE